MSREQEMRAHRKAILAAERRLAVAVRSIYSLAIDELAGASALTLLAQAPASVRQEYAQARDAVRQAEDAAIAAGLATRTGGRLRWSRRGGRS